MTREQLKQVRDALDSARAVCGFEGALADEERCEAAILLLDAELASEAREWRAWWFIGDGQHEFLVDGPRLSREDLERRVANWSSSYPAFAGGSIRLESRTPAGQWEAER